MRNMTSRAISFIAGSALALFAVALADPVDGGLGFQPSAAPFADQVHQFHNWVLMPIITAISLFVLALLIVVCVKFNSKANPNSDKHFHHNTMLEVLWTGIPILILLFIAVFSFPLLFDSDVIPDGKSTVFESDGSATTYTIDNDFPQGRTIASGKHVEVFALTAAGREKLALNTDYKLEGLKTEKVSVVLNTPLRNGESLQVIAGRSRVGAGKFLDLFGEDNSQIVAAPAFTIKATGFQWGWSYNYPDQGDFELTALLMQKADLEDPSKYLFEPTTRIVVPVGETIRVITTGRDVIHSWTIPAFAIKVDAVPGRLNETWFNASREGVFYGQCSEICGKDHAYMPIAVEVVSAAEFETWADSQRVAAGLEPMYSIAQLDPVDLPTDATTTDME